MEIFTSTETSDTSKSAKNEGEEYFIIQNFRPTFYRLT